MIRPHVPIGQLVLVGGQLPGIILGRLDGHYYSVFVMGSVHVIHRDDMIVVDPDDY
tara:strand:+ start:201 stop:368 length:168 start_codon:yes stop_codon:yes gene_type:complete